MDHSERLTSAESEETQSGGDNSEAECSNATSQRKMAAKLMVDFQDGSLVGAMSLLDQENIRIRIEDNLMRQLEADQVFELSDILSYISEGMELIVQDDFSKCFRENPAEPWNWNAYLFPLWCIGVIVRYAILLPIRFISLLAGFILFAFGFVAIKLVFVKNIKLRQALERRLVKFLAGAFVFSWTGVIKYHGIIPKRQPNQIYVANHTSMIDMIILQQMNTFATVGQKHSGWVGFLQEEVLGCLGCIWFNRSEQSDRKKTADRIKQHISNPDANRLLVFPEGTCVNNEYCVQFKKGPFEYDDCSVCPIAIKYNKTFVDAFWNSRRRPFHWHLFDLMSSWAVVCDVWYLEPQTRRPDESAIEFAARVKKMITDTAKLHNVDWDGYMKYFAPSQKFMLAKQKLFADSLHRRITVGRINEKSKDVHETEHNLTSDTNDQSLRRRQIK